MHRLPGASACNCVLLVIAYHRATVRRGGASRPWRIRLVTTEARPCAADATLAGDKLRQKFARQSNPFAVVFALLFLGALGVAVVAGAVPTLILIAYAALSLITFVAYAIDKSAARRGGSRISETALHLWGLAGGWPGVLIAQQALRHKSKKISFRVVLWGTVLFNCVVLAWLQTESGKEVVHRFLV